MIFSFVEEYLKQAPHEHNTLINALSTNPKLSNTDINLLVLEIFFGGIDAVSVECGIYMYLILMYIIIIYQLICIRLLPH